MDTLHTVMRTINTQTKSGSEHLSVFREFLKHLDGIQRKAPMKSPAKTPRSKTPPRRKPAKPTRRG